MGSRPTKQDIADSLGVSIITVHRALKRNGYVSASLRERIEREATRIGYRPHRAAQSLVKSTPHLIAVLSTEAPSFYWDEVERGVRTAASQIADFGFKTQYERIALGDTERYLATIRDLHAAQVSAVAIVNNLEYQMERIFALIDELGIPYVTLNIDAPTSRRRAYIGVDHEAEGRLAANFLTTHRASEAEFLLIADASPRATALEGADIAQKRFHGFESVLKQQDARSRRILLDRGKASLDSLESALRNEPTQLGGFYLTAIDPEIAERISKLSAAPIVAGTASPQSFELLRRAVVSAVIYQNPVLQGYYAVQMLEHLAESPESGPLEDVILVQSLLLRENMHLPGNHQLMVGGPGSLWGAPE